MSEAEEALREKVKECKGWMKKAPYLCYDLAIELIRAAEYVLEEERTEEEHGRGTV